MEIVFERDNSKVKKPIHLKKKNIFIIYSHRTVTVETAGCTNVDTNIILKLPKKAKVFLTSSFRGHEIFEINNEKTRLWMEVLNTSYTEDLKITRNGVLGFLVIEPENLCFKYATKKKTKKETGLPKN